jgi:hypothetical protein
MQRLTKYSLLLKAILKNTEDLNQRRDLLEMVRAVIIPLQFYNQFADPDPNSFWDPLGHALINYTDTKAKCCHLEKFTFKGT